MGALEDAKTYIGARFGPSYRAWEALTDDDKNRTLVSATSYIDSQQWQGTATGIVSGNVTFLQWPRSGIDGVDSTTVPTAIVNATFELAVLISADPDLPQGSDSGSNVQSLGAGPAQISFFRPLSPADGNATVLPPLVDRMIGRWLAGAAITIAGVITGGSSRSDFRDCNVCCGSPCSCSTGRRDLVSPL